MNEETKKAICIKIAIALGTVCAVLLIVTESSSIVVRGLMIGIGLLFIVGGLVMRWPVELGLLILCLAFAVSLFTGVWISEPGRLVDILEAHPHFYLNDVWYAFRYYVLPPALGLVFSIIGYRRERKSPTGVFEWWLPLVVFGCFFFSWGALGLWGKYTCYLDATAYWLYSVDIADPVLAVYATESVAFILWLFAGVLFILSPVFKILRNKRRRDPHNN